jgi:hypothetical protein
VKEGKSLVQQEPIAIKGLPSLAGKWAKKSCRLPDIILRSRYVNGKPTLVARREPITGNAYWEVKDRTGKLENYQNGFCPPDWPVLWRVIQGGSK